MREILSAILAFFSIVVIFVAAYVPTIKAIGHYDSFLVGIGTLLFAIYLKIPSQD